ncbi:MAG: hypothetical protein JJ953_03770 [Gracilimonas sp.]|uniref:hypothetical protein n=1 Tax=Gracilimonas TaxID=649462 RepID=UPI001B0E1021|nr:hypothetical protein [Gracilimonas sp.]MBO6585203.1 hypothetical protein [Gracilimonas sp.]MBO6615525.1 hypothetical protein [Gracilimonas sp.]
MTGTSYGLLILPLLSGFIFIKTSQYYSFKIYRYSNQELFLLSGVWGTLLFIPAYLLYLYILEGFPSIIERWDDFINISYSLPVFSTLFIGYLFGKYTNFLTTKEERIGQLIYEDNDAIEILLMKALKEAKLVSVTLRSDKVYVGFVSNNFVSPNFDTKSFKLIPYLSGYRDNNKELIFTNYYEEITAKVEDEIKGQLDGFESSDFEIGIVFSEVISVNIFHPSVYDLFHANEKTDDDIPNLLDLISDGISYLRTFT